MAKKNRYEGMFLLKVREAKEDWDGLVTFITDIIESVDGTVTDATRWDERKLTFDIKGQSRAAYMLTHFEAPPTGMDTIRHKCKMSPRVLRELILRDDIKAKDALVPKDEKPETPGAADDEAKPDVIPPEIESTPPQPEPEAALPESETARKEEDDGQFEQSTSDGEPDEGSGT